MESKHCILQINKALMKLINNKIKLIILLPAYMFIHAGNIYAQHKVSFSIVPTLGFNNNVSTMFSDERDKQYYVLQHPASTKGLHATLGIQAQVFPDWLAAFKYGTTELGGAYIYNLRESQNGNVYISYGSSVMNLAAQTEYTFYNFKIMKGRLRDWGLSFQVGSGFNYSYIYRVDRSDTPFRLPTARIGNELNEIGYEVQTAKGAMGINVGLNAQFTYKNHKWLKFGVWYNYIPKPPVYFDFELENLITGDIDQFRLKVTQHQFLFFLEFPIKLFSL